MTRLPSRLVRLSLFACLLFILPATAGAQETWTVGDQTGLQNALSIANPGDTIQFTSNITLSSELPSIATNLTIDGRGFTLSGASQYRGLVIGDLSGATPFPVSVTVQDLTIANTIETGGTGASSVDGGGGGGGGLGGAIFVGDAATVTLSGVNIAGSRAAGGSGGGVSGAAGFAPGGSGTGFVGVGGSGGLNPTGGGYGGGGGGFLGSGAPGGFGGGDGSTAGGGGGGAGLGGAIFVQAGGSLTVAGPLTINGNSVTAGLGGTGAADGSAYGAGMFLGGFGDITFAPGAGQTVTIADVIADADGASGLTGFGSRGLFKDGAGTLVLSGANQYSGGTQVIAGTLSVTSDLNLGTPNAFFGLAGPSTLALTGSNTFARGLFLDASGGNPTISVGSGVDATWSGVIAEEVPTVLRVTGGGSLALTNNLNSYSGGTIVTGGSRVVVSDDLALGGVATLTLGDAVSSGTLGVAPGSSPVSARNVSLGAGGGIFDVQATSLLTLNGQVTGSGVLGKAGAGTLVLSGANNYTGGTQVFAGTLQAGAADVFGTGRMDVRSGAALDLNSFNQTLGSLTGAGNVTLGSGTLGVGVDGTTTTFSGAIGGTGSLLKMGPGSLTLSGANTYSGGTFVSQGILIGTTTSLQGNIQNGALVVFDQVASGTYAGAMSGSGELVKNGAGALTLSGVNTYTGGTTVNAGQLIGSTQSLQGNIANSAAVTFDQAFNGGYTGVLSGTGTLSKAGTGTLTLVGANTYTGATLVNGGVLQAGALNVFAANSAFSLGAGTTLDLNNFSQTIASVAGAGNITLGSGALTTGGDNTSTTLGGIISGTGSLFKVGTGTLTLNGANTYSGGTTVSQGTLIGTATSLQGNIQNNGLVVFNQATAGTYGGAMTGTGSLTKQGAGTLALSGANTYTGGTAISAGLLVGNASSLQGNILNNAALEFTQASAGTYGGVISGTGTFTKTGAGALTLTGSSTFTGAASINVGTLLTGTTNVFTANTPVAVASGAIFDLNGFNQTIGALSGGGNISLGSATLTTGGANASATLSGVLSGTGSLVKVGTGALTLAGANTYTGGTTVSAGSLVGNTTSLQGNILNNALVTFNQATAGIYAGSMSGTGSLTKSGTGTLALTGTNTYTGGTTITGGTLIGTSTSLQGTITTPGLLVFSQAASGTFNGSLAGSGSLQKLGAGTLTLATRNTLTGGTTISAGVLRAGAANVFSSGGAISIGAGTTLDLNGFSHTLNGLSGAGNVALGSATLTTGGGGSTTLSGVISGTGSLVKSGSGTLTLSGANTYSGGTTVSGGMLVGNTTSLQGSILNNARVVFSQGFNGTYAGAMSGTGILEKAGSGALTLTGTNTYTGGTVISGGSIVGTAASLGGTIVNNSSLTFGGNADGTFNGTLGGNGSLRKIDLSTLTLNGTHSFSGSTRVSQGALVLNGTLGGSVVVDPGALFVATGGVLGSLNLNGGTLRIPTPAFASASLGAASNGVSVASTGDRLDTPPIFTVGGNLVAGDGSVIGLPIGPGPNPSLLVGGVAALTGTRLDATPIELGTQRNLSFLALTAANGLTVANTTVDTRNPLLISALRQDGTSLFVTMLNLGVPLATAVSPHFSSVGAALDQMKGNLEGDRGFVVRELLALTDDELEDAMRIVAGELHASNQHLAVRSSEMFTDLIRSEMTEREHEAEEGQPGWGGERIRWFGQFSREHASFDPDGGALGGGADLSDGGGGFEFRVSDRFLVGGGGGFGFGSMALDGLAAGSDFAAPRAFGIVGFKPKAFSLRAGGSLSRSKSKSKRAIFIIATLPLELGGLPLSGGIDREALSEEVTVQSDQWGEYADRQDFGTYRLDYMFGVRRARFARNGFTETGAGALSLRSDGETMNLTDTDVKIYLWRRKGSVRPYAETLVRRSSGFQYKLPVEFAADGDSDFETAGLPMGQNAFAGRMGVTFVRRIGSLTFEYRFRKASGQTVQSGDLRFRF